MRSEMILKLFRGHVRSADDDLQGGSRDILYLAPVNPRVTLILSGGQGHRWDLSTSEDPNALQPLGPY
uniref:Uncharacterized protein n=1 Tax=Knipowitschia caucasica TaxID=637954 RepID=A0AAV2M4D2_KNICA